MTNMLLYSIVGMLSRTAMTRRLSSAMTKTRRGVARFLRADTVKTLGKRLRSIGDTKPTKKRKRKNVTRKTRRKRRQEQRGGA